MIVPVRLTISRKAGFNLQAATGKVERETQPITIEDLEEEIIF